LTWQGGPVRVEKNKKKKFTKMMGGNWLTKKEKKPGRGEKGSRVEEEEVLRSNKLAGAGERWCESATIQKSTSQKKVQDGTVGRSKPRGRKPIAATNQFCTRESRQKQVG